uniref:Uncharacterized protein n=1 Tax=Ciona intestinalis TaxID=7719 RepID=H2Y0T5_CIOIN
MVVKKGSCHCSVKSFKKYYFLTEMLLAKQINTM